MTAQPQEMDGADLKAIQDYIYSTVNDTEEWKRAEQAYQNILTARSHPHPAPIEPARLACVIDFHAYQHGNIIFEDIRACSGVSCNYCGRYTESEHDAAIAHNAREEVLDELDAWRDTDGDNVVSYLELHKKIQSLREREKG